MDKRDLLRAERKFGKFFDPLVILLIICTFSVSILSLRSLTPRTFSNDAKQKNVLGLEEGVDILKLEGIFGSHEYITSENFTQISPTHYKYTSLIKSTPAGRISKPVVKILHLDKEESLKIQLAYTNSNTTKISIVDKENNTRYILKEKGLTHFQSIDKMNTSKILYLSLENEKPVFFNQYLEINFFVNP
jgi:hypothetical protein